MFLHFQHYGERETLANREMKLLLPRGGGAGGIIRGWRLRGQGAKPFFRFDPFFQIQFKNTSNLILLGFKMSSESFFIRISKQGLLFDIYDFSIFKI